MALSITCMGITGVRATGHDFEMKSLGNTWAPEYSVLMPSLVKWLRPTGNMDTGMASAPRASWASQGRHMGLLWTRASSYELVVGAVHWDILDTLTS